MATSTYSFLDLVGSIHSPVMRSDYIFTGEGAGSVTVTKSQERTAQDVAADGSVMVSKVAGNNGTVTIEVQQTSPLQKWLENWFHYLENADTSDWASTTMLLSNKSTGEDIICTGVSPQKEADKPYQAQGQRVSWTLMCADVKFN